MKSIASIFFGLMLMITIFFSMQIIGENSLGNSNLDTFSTGLISNYSNNLNADFDPNNDFNSFESNLSVNGTFDSEDVFAQEYLEGKSSSTAKTGIIAKLAKMPDMIVLSLGVEENNVIWIKSIIALIITVLLGFAAYRAIFGGGKVTDN